MTAAVVLRNHPALEAARDAAPEGVRAELIDGALFMAPAPRYLHQHVSGRLFLSLAGAPAYRRKRLPDGTLPPGGWVFVAVPELHLGSMPDISNPDLAAWRSERAPSLAAIAIHTAPDWVCEVLSPSTEAHDRGTKLPMFARYGVAHAWLVDPALRRLEVYRLDRGALREVARFEGEAVVSVAPFTEVTFSLASLWE